MTVLAWLAGLGSGLVGLIGLWWFFYAGSLSDRMNQTGLSSGATLNEFHLLGLALMLIGAVGMTLSIAVGRSGSRSNGSA